MAEVFEIDMVKDSTMQTMNAILAKMASGNADGLQPKSYQDVQSIVRLGLAPYVFCIGDVIEVARVSDIKATLGEHTGITGCSVDEDKFIAKMNEAGDKAYEFIHDGSTWTYEGEPVIIADYGVSVTGTANNGDVVVVIETASTINMVVVDFMSENRKGSLKIKDNTRKYGMVLMSEKILYNLQYDSTEAMYACETALPAGTYNFTLCDNYNTEYGGGKTYQFTTTKQIPAGGQIVFNWGYNVQASASKINTFSKAEDTTALEANISVTEGNGGTSLGTAKIAVDGNMNSIHRLRYGSNRMSTSAIRQHLNSAAKAGSVWKPQTKFDRPPSWVTSTAGFMHGLDPEFINMCATVMVDTVLSPVSGDTTTTEANAGTGYETTEDVFFLASRSEIFGGKENNSDNGVPFEYYSANSDHASATTADDKNRIKYNASGTPYYWWERTPIVDGAGYVRGCYPSGFVGYYSNANSSVGVVPACIVA